MHYLFQSKIFIVSAVCLACIFGSCSKNQKVVIPRPFSVVIDDLGWMQGSDLSNNEFEGPYRLGVDRTMTLDDYQYVLDIAKESGIRLQGAFIVGELDREKALSKYPTTNMYGADWTNDENISDLQLEVVDFVKNNSAYIEFGLHGVCHEYWLEPGNMKRAEWYNLEEKEPWKEEIMRNHIAATQDILAQYGLDKANGHDFPQSFVPPAQGFYWNPKGDYSLGKVLSDAGVKYASFGFDIVEELDPPLEERSGEFDHNVFVIYRGLYGNYWDMYNKTPTTPIEDQTRDIIESHWPNFLAEDPKNQPAASRKWEEFFKSVKQNKDRHCSKNTEEFVSQWLYRTYAEIKVNDDYSIEIDNSKMPSSVYDNNILHNLILKIPLNEGMHVSGFTSDQLKVTAYYETENHGLLYLEKLEPKKYTAKISIGSKAISPVVYNDGTYNVYELECNDNQSRIKIKLYGSQTLKLKGVNGISGVKSINEQIKIDTSYYSTSDSTLMLNISAHNIQGEKGELIISH